MASPTEAEVQAQIGKVVKILDQIVAFGSENTPNLIDMIDDVVANTESDFATETLEQLRSIRQNINRTIVGAQAAAALTPLFQDYAKVLNIPFTDIQTIFEELNRDFDTNAKSVNSRDLVYATMAAGGSNVGDGVLSRLTVDRFAADLEACTSELKTAECTRDQHSGADENEEIFLLYGANANRDALAITGSGRNAVISARSKRASDAYLRNASFEEFTGAVATGNLTGLTGWTVASAGFTNIYVDQTAANVYRGYPGIGTSTSLVFEDNERIYQALSNVSANFGPGVPYYMQIAYNREIGGGDGTLTIRLGSKSVAVILAAETGWNILRLPLDENLYFDNWNQTDPDVEIELSGNTVGTVIVDDLVLTPMTFFEGTWWALVGGATKFLRLDLFTGTDTETGAILQEWFWRAFGLSLISVTGGAETWADPA